MYDVTVTREDGLWVADIAGEGLGPAATDTEHFGDLDVEVRDLIAGLAGTDPDALDLAWRYVINGQDVTAEIDRAAATEREYRSSLQARDAARVAALTALDEAGVSQAVIGDVLGLSHQRVHQLAKAS
jgi:hypothetical protein